MHRIDHRLHRQRTQISDGEFLAAFFQRFEDSAIEGERETGRAFEQAEKHDFRRLAKRPRLLEGEERIKRRAGFPQRYEFAAGHIGASPRVRFERRHV